MMSAKDGLGAIFSGFLRVLRFFVVCANYTLPLAAYDTKIRNPQSAIRNPPRALLTGA
jgi:hypothetical protein